MVEDVIAKLHEARDFAIIAHASQKYGDKPYIFHLDNVALIVLQHIGGDISIEEAVNYIQAAYLHDTLEDAVIYGKKISYNDLYHEYHFNKTVVDLVYAVTDGKGKNRKDKKAIMYDDMLAYPKSIKLKLADTISNVSNSVKNNESTLDMYVKEFPKFYGTFYSEDTHNMWTHLQNLISHCQ